MVQDLISVIIPCYNDGIYLPETIHKLQTQTYKHVEVIIVNDGSTDSYTLEVLQKLPLQYQNISVINKENGGMSSARNFGIKQATGQFIVFLDADDYFDNHFFEKALYHLHKNKKIGAVSSYIKMFGEFNKLSKPRGGGLQNFLFSNQCPVCCMMRKAVVDKLEGFDENMINGYEDWEFFLRLTKLGYVVHIIPETLFYYRQTKKSTHKNKTIPNRKNLIDYMLKKHGETFLTELGNLINEGSIVYTKSRVSWPNIFKLIKYRLWPSQHENDN